MVDIQGKKMNAIDVFSICIKYLSDELKKLVNSRYIHTEVIRQFFLIEAIATFTDDVETFW